MSKQYEPNPAYCGWLLEQARCRYLACSGSAVSHKGCSILFYIINHLLTKLVCSTWQDVVLVLFGMIIDLDSIWWFISPYTCKERTWPILSCVNSCLVDKPPVCISNYWHYIPWCCVHDVLLLLTIQMLYIIVIDITNVKIVVSI